MIKQREPKSTGSFS